MIIKTASFLKSCTKSSQYPSYNFPEFAFFGRSNVGKSSLLNMLLGKKGLVKTGSRPGVTKTINFFIVNEHMSFTDLPGFGYARLPMAIKKKLLPMIKDYISKRENLVLAFLLIDIRRLPGEYEADILELLTGNGIPVAVILTKCDKVSRNHRVKNISGIQKALEIDRDSFFQTSAESGEGRKELLKLINEFSSRRL